MRSSWAAVNCFLRSYPSPPSVAMVRIANEDVRVSEHAKTEATVGPEREDRTLERKRLDTVVRQRFDHSRKISEQRAVFLTCLIHIDAEGISNFVGHHVGRDTIEDTPGQRGQPMLRRHPRETGPVDAVEEHLPDRCRVRPTWQDSGESQ